MFGWDDEAQLFLAEEKDSQFDRRLRDIGETELILQRDRRAASRQELMCPLRDQDCAQRCTYCVKDPDFRGL